MLHPATPHPVAIQQKPDVILLAWHQPRMTRVGDGVETRGEASEHSGVQVHVRSSPVVVVGVDVAVVGDGGVCAGPVVTIDAHHHLAKFSGLGDL